jgi:zinc-ribbon domain
MFCSKCGTDHLDDSRFCRKCGQALGVVSTGGGAAAVMAPAPAQREKRPASRLRRIPLFIGILVLIFVVGAWVENWRTREALITNQNSQNSQPRLHTQITGGKAFTIPAGSTNSFIFDVPSGAYNVSIKGHFSATGGTGNDIIALLLTADDYENWQNRHPFQTLYNSGQVTQETVNVKLPEDRGKYYFVFNNKFSLLTPKAVQANLTMTCYTR